MENCCATKGISDLLSVNSISTKGNVDQYVSNKSILVVDL